MSSFKDPRSCQTLVSGLSLDIFLFVFLPAFCLEDSFDKVWPYSTLIFFCPGLRAVIRLRCIFRVMTLTTPSPPTAPLAKVAFGVLSALQDGDACGGDGHGPDL